MNNKTKECKYLGEYSGDCWLCSGNIFQRCMYSNKEKCLLLKNEQRKNKINMLEQQLLAEQAKNSELEATLKILKINHKLTISELNNEQANNKKLVEALEKIENCWNNIDSDKFAGHRLYITLTQALNEVNKC